LLALSCPIACCFFARSACQSKVSKSGSALCSSQIEAVCAAEGYIRLTLPM
jgi:hypothetical protein